MIKDAWGAIKYNGGDVYHIADTIVITKTSQLIKIVDNKSAIMVGSSATSNGNSKDNKNGICEAEVRVRTFMRMLRVKEGTKGKKGYTMLFGEKDFVKDYNKNTSIHLKIVVKTTKYSSSAAGTYQIMEDTFNDKGFANN